MKKTIKAVVPASEPVTIAQKTTVTTTRTELRFCAVRGGKFDLRLYDVTEDGEAEPHIGGYVLTRTEAERLRDAISEALLGGT